MVRYLTPGRATRRLIMNGKNAGAVGGTIWFIGWLFTIGFAKLVWWKAILGLVVWAYYLGVAVAG